MSVKDRAKEILKEWGSELSKDLETSLVKALRDGGNRNVQNPALNFREDAYFIGDGVELNIIASGEYWKWIESGRKVGAKNIPADVVGKKWQGLNGIDPRRILLQIRAKVKTKKRKLNIKTKPLDYDKAAKSLSFIIQKSIKKKGIKAKPFTNRVLEDGRIEELALRLRQELGKEFKLEIISDVYSN